MNRGRREETFLKKGFLSPPRPPSHLPKTFDLIESLFMVGGKIDIVPCENGFEKNSRSNDASGVFL